MLLAIVDTCSEVSRLRVSMPSVSTTTALRCGTRPPPRSFRGDGSGGLGNGVVQRRLPERRLHVIERGLERGNIGRERRDAVEPRVEAEHRRFVARLQRAEHVPRGLLCIHRLRPRLACCR